MAASTAVQQMAAAGMSSMLGSVGFTLNSNTRTYRSAAMPTANPTAPLVLYPIVWLILLPFRIVGIAVGGVLELLRAIIYLPARVLSPRRGSVHAAR